MKHFFLLITLSSFSLYGEIHFTKEISELPDEPRELYFDLIKKVIVNTIYEDPGINGGYEKKNRLIGCDYPTLAHTMIGMKRLDNIQYCLQQVIINNVPGDCMETGVWRGGACILMRAMLKAYGETTRKVWVADSFEGVPPPNAEKYPKDRGLNLHKIAFLSVSMEDVQNNFKKYDLLDSQVVFLKGWFSQTLPNAPVQQLALLRLDGDLYESTMDALVNLYHKVSIGGYIIVDDYWAIAACAQAVNDFREQHYINDPMITIDWASVYWQKSN